MEYKVKVKCIWFTDYGVPMAQNWRPRWEFKSEPGQVGVVDVRIAYDENAPFEVDKEYELTISGT